MREIHNLYKFKNKRKYLRNNTTKSERLLWNKIKNNKLGYKFRRQHSIEKYIVDFYCPELRLIIELDGESHKYNNQKNKDYIREEKLINLKFIMVRYENFDVLENLEDVLIDIKNKCDQINKNKLT